MNEEKNLKIITRFLLYIITLASVFLYGVINTYALETKTIYSSNSSGTLGGQNTFTYGYLNQGGVQTISTASINSTVNVRGLALIFYMYEPVLINKTYTMEINFTGYQLINTFTSNMVQVGTCNLDVCNDNVIVSVEKSNPNGWSNKLTIQFNPVTSGSILYINLSDKTATRYILGTYEGNTFGVSSVKLESTNQNQDIIDNQTNNTNNIINNNNSNTQDIINNQDQNTQDIIDSNKSCNTYGLTDIKDDNKFINSSGSLTSSSLFGVTDYINIYNSDMEVLNILSSSGGVYSCFYNKDKNLIGSCSSVTLSSTGVVTIPNNAYYFRFTIFKTANVPIIKVCKNGNQAISDNLTDLNETINDDDIGGATQDGADFILDFDTNTFGLTSIVTAPLNLIQSLTSSSCSELELPLPFLNNKKLNLPCMITIYQNTFGSLFTMYQTITFGIIAYWVCVRIFNQVKDFKNPEHDEIEVVDL